MTQTKKRYGPPLQYSDGFLNPTIVFEGERHVPLFHPSFKRTLFARACTANDHPIGTPDDSATQVPRKLISRDRVFHRKKGVTFDGIVVLICTAL
jgi:hypothetical protein